MKIAPLSWLWRGLMPALLFGLLAAGCAERIIPVLKPATTARVKPGGEHQALVGLPKGAVASVYLEYGYESGRVWLSRIGVVNHHPQKVTVFFTRSRIYVDDGDPLGIVSYRKLDSRKSNIDFHILRSLPQGAKGKWLIPQRRNVTQSTLRGPTIVLFYSVSGYDGFAKVQYRALWGAPE